MLPFRMPFLLALALVSAHICVPDASAQIVQRGSLRQGSVPVALEPPLPGARMSSGFGLRRHPVLGVTMMHEGIDFAAPTGTPIRAAAAGVVAAAGYEAGYGSFVRLRHDHRLETVYGHMSRIAVVPGETVPAGNVIGYVGSTGLATGPHLHFEVRRDGTAVDPAAADRPSPVLRTTGSVDVVRGGRTASDSGGPAPVSQGRVEVVRGRR